MTQTTINPMRAIRISKVTLNFGAGTDQAKLDKGMKLLEVITGIKPVKTKANKRVPTWGLRPGLPIGCKITLRGEKAEKVLRRLLKARDDTLSASMFDTYGTISFGVKEYIDIPDVPYDPAIGIIGLQASVTLERPGFRLKHRRIGAKHIHTNHSITQQEAMDFAKEYLKVIIE